MEYVDKIEALSYYLIKIAEKSCTGPLSEEEYGNIKSGLNDYRAFLPQCDYSANILRRHEITQDQSDFIEAMREKNFDSSLKLIIVNLPIPDEDIIPILRPIRNILDFIYCVSLPNVPAGCPRGAYKPCLAGFEPRLTELFKFDLVLPVARNLLALVASNMRKQYDMQLIPNIEEVMAQLDVGARLDLCYAITRGTSEMKTILEKESYVIVHNFMETRTSNQKIWVEIPDLIPQLVSSLTSPAPDYHVILRTIVELLKGYNEDIVRKMMYEAGFGIIISTVYPKLSKRSNKVLFLSVVARFCSNSVYKYLLLSQNEYSTITPPTALLSDPVLLAPECMCPEGGGLLTKVIEQLNNTKPYQQLYPALCSVLTNFLTNGSCSDQNFVFARLSMDKLVADITAVPEIDSYRVGAQVLAALIKRNFTVMDRLANLLNQKELGQPLFAERLTTSPYRTSTLVRSFFINCYVWHNPSNVSITEPSKKLMKLIDDRTLKMLYRMIWFTVHQPRIDSNRNCLLTAVTGLVIIEKCGQLQTSLSQLCNSPMFDPLTLTKFRRKLRKWEQTDMAIDKRRILVENYISHADVDAVVSRYSEQLKSFLSE